MYERYARGELPEGVAAMQALLAADTAEAARDGLIAGAEPLRPLLTAEAHALVHAMLNLASHHEPAGPEAWAATFDRAAALSPEASVALYSLGDAERLAEATREVADWLVEERLVAPGRRVLEIGCGIGRFVAALAPRSRLTVGVDVSGRMCAEAAARTLGVEGAAVVRTAGRDLRAFADAAFDLVLAVDSWPYLVNAGVEAAMFAEACRVLTPGGDLVIVNWSYRADAEADRADAATLAGRHGLRLRQDTGPALTHWNGAVFRFASGSG